MSVEAQVQGFIANVEYNLRYYNDEEEPIEASFVFPLHDNSAIYRFEAKIDDRLVVGEVQEKEQVGFEDTDNCNLHRKNSVARTNIGHILSNTFWTI